MDKLAALLNTAWMSMPEEEMVTEWETPSLSMHLESMKPIIDSASVEAIMQFVEDLISYKLSPNGEED
jgi:hypothetical protein